MHLLFSYNSYTYFHHQNINIYIRQNLYLSYTQLFHKQQFL